MAAKDLGDGGEGLEGGRSVAKTTRSGAFSSHILPWGGSTIAIDGEGRALKNCLDRDHRRRGVLVGRTLSKGHIDPLASPDWSPIHSAFRRYGA